MEETNMNDENDNSKIWCDEGAWLYDGGSVGRDFPDYYWGIDQQDQDKCRHIWKHYKGFHMEDFDFCIYCDLKRTHVEGTE